jgi:hypothetical protein
MLFHNENPAMHDEERTIVGRGWIVDTGARHQVEATEVRFTRTGGKWYRTGVLGPKSVQPISGAFREMDHPHGNRTRYSSSSESLPHGAPRVKGTAQQMFDSDLQIVVGASIRVRRTLRVRQVFRDLVIRLFTVGGRL